MIDKELLKLIKGERRYIVYTALLNIAAMLANVGVTAGICLAIKIFADGGSDTADFVAPFCLIFAGIAARFASTASSGRFKSVLGAGVKKALRGKAYGKLLKLGRTGAASMGTAGLTQVCTEGIEQLDLYYSSYLPQFFYSMLAPLLLFGICVFIDFRTALVLLAGLPIIPVSIIAVSKYSKRIFAKYWGKYTSMGDGFLDALQGMKELKIFGADARHNDKINQSAEEFRRVTMKVLVMQLFSVTVMDTVAFGGAGAGAAVAVFSALNHGLNPVYALFLILISAEFFLPLRALGSAFHVAMNGAQAGRKILSLLDLEEPALKDGRIPKGRGLSLSSVVFSYGGGKKVLDGVDMSFPEKRLTAIVGESGSGKSTVVRLLTSERKPDSGSVLLGGQELYSLSRPEYYGRIAVVSHDTYIFNDTVRNNFLLANPRASGDAIWNALKRADLDVFVRESGGLDRVISEDADNLSGGQKQRLALAVNLTLDKDIYIFDEATSNIDTESEEVVMRNIRELKKTASVILISHRLANVKDADLIYVLKDGRIAESGKHAELLRSPGEYSRLYTAQKRLENGYKEDCGQCAEAE